MVTSPECRDARADMYSRRAPDLSSSGSEAVANIGDTAVELEQNLLNAESYPHSR